MDIHMFDHIPTIRVTEVKETKSTEWWRPSLERILDAQERGEFLEDVLVEARSQEQLEVTYEGMSLLINVYDEPFKAFGYRIVRSVIRSDNSGTFWLAKVHQPE